MTDNVKLLSSIIKTTHIAQIRIRCIIDTAVCSELRNILKIQLRKYNSIEREARSVANARGWEFEPVCTTARVNVIIITKIQLLFWGIESRIAAMVIKASTEGIIKCIQNKHSLKQSDASVAILSEKLLDCETANIEKLQGFL